MMQIVPPMKMIMNLCKQDRLNAWGSLRVAFTQSPLSKIKIFCVFESVLLHILLSRQYNKYIEAVSRNEKSSTFESR
mgnify:CR=1 FL=1